MSDIDLYPSLHDVLRQRVPRVPVTYGLIACNCLVFLAMLASGSGFWHTANGIQLAWGANFGPATQDGQWWRLGSAMFLHFGALHLMMNMWALWDGGQLVERMYGPLRFTAIYFFSGIAGNLLSLVSQQGMAVSGGASGAIFGVYGALLLYLWRERQFLYAHEFRWLFWGAAGFAGITIVLGFFITGIDNAAHIGGFLGGLLSGAGLARPLFSDQPPPNRQTWLAGGVAGLALLLLVSLIPAPAYRWSEETVARQMVSQFLREDAEISRNWQAILSTSPHSGVSFDELAGRIDSVVGEPYEESFEQLSQLDINPALPSAASLDILRRYAGLRRDASRTLAEGLRNNDAEKIRKALALDQQSRELAHPSTAPAPTQPAIPPAAGNP
jgi:rhomboid protease GluP